MVWIAGVLAVFLFYAVVKREHKIAFFKIVGVLALAVAAFIGYYSGVNEWHDYQRKHGIEVRIKSFKAEPASKNLFDGLQLEELDIEICNKRNIELKSCSFYISGFQAGRSTPYRITQKSKDYSSDDFYDDRSYLTSDFIVPANKCTTLSNKRRGLFTYDRYEVISSKGVWKE